MGGMVGQRVVGRGRSKREGIYVNIELSHFITQQKLTQICKATVPQFRKKKKEKVYSTEFEPYSLHLPLPGIIV